MPQLVWLITGCSSGLGQQFVHSILARGDKVIATARNPTSLSPLSTLGASTLELDLTSSQTSINATIATAVAIHGHVDVLVNNASYISIGTQESLTTEDLAKQFETNVFGTMKVTKAVLPYMRERRQGNLVFIGSLSGWVGHPGNGAYAGSKFALEGIVESLSQETALFGVDTLLVEPGRFRTNLLSSGNMQTATSTIPEYEGLLKGLMGHLMEQDMNQPGDPKKLVAIVADAVRKEGVFAGKDVPFRLPLGGDCFDEMKGKCEQMLRVLGEWEEVIKSTDFEE